MNKIIPQEHPFLGDKSLTSVKSWDHPLDLQSLSSERKSKKIMVHWVDGVHFFRREGQLIQ